MALSVHGALSILLSLHVQKRGLKWSDKTSKKHGIKLFHLNYSTPVYRALGMVAGNAIYTEFYNHFR